MLNPDRSLRTTDTAWAVDPSAAKAAGAVVLGAAALSTAALLGDWFIRPAPPLKAWRIPGLKRREAPAEARGLHAAAALLSASVLLDSAVEHYRGAYENPGMYTPLVVSGLNLLAATDGATGGRLPRRVRDGAYGLGGVVGAIGAGFHVYNLLRRPGGLNWLNAFYAAPVGAPAALSLAGAIGLAANRVEEAPRGGLHLFGVPVGRALSALTGAGLLGTVGEAGLLHFRGSFQNPFMWLPVSLPPVAAALMGKAAFELTRPRARLITRAWLALTAVMGVAGVGFHAYGVSRAMGGWRNWSQNVVDGPPLPAPPSFSALAIAAWAALALRDREDD